MSNPVFFVRPAIAAMAVALAWSGVSAVVAADTTPGAPPAVVGAAPAPVAPPACESCQTCQHGIAKKNCSVCDKWPHKNKPQYPVTLCPGACFGYFQTQWRKWDDACPYPYLGIGVSDAPRTMN